jgi:hypothetical protein
MAAWSGKMPTTSVRRRISLLSRSWGLLEPDLAPDLYGEDGERQQLGAGRVEVLSHLGKLVRWSVERSIILGHNGFSVRLVEDGVEQGTHPRPGGFRGDRHQVCRVVGAAALPGRPGQRRADRGDQTGMGVAGDQRGPGQAAGDQVAEERQPAPSSAEVTCTPRISR